MHVQSQHFEGELTNEDIGEIIANSSEVLVTRAEGEDWFIFARAHDGTCAVSWHYLDSETKVQHHYQLQVDDDAPGDIVNKQAGEKEYHIPSGCWVEEEIAVKALRHYISKGGIDTKLSWKKWSES